MLLLICTRGKYCGSTCHPAPAAQHRGSVSAEHGLGLMKAGCIGYSKPPAAVAVLRAVQAALAPHGIMNPYKVLPPTECRGFASLGEALFAVPQAQV